MHTLQVGKQAEGRAHFYRPASSKVPSTQNSAYAKVGRGGVGGGAEGVHTLLIPTLSR